MAISSTTSRSIALTPRSQTCFGHIDEWHVDIGKSLRENDMGEKGLPCLDGGEY